MKKDYKHIYLDPILDSLLTVMKDYMGRPKTRLVSDAIIYYAYEEALKQDEEGRFMMITAADKAVSYLDKSAAIARKALRKSGLETGSKNLEKYLISSKGKQLKTKKLITQERKEREAIEAKRNNN